MADENIEIGETTLVERRYFYFHRWWLASAALLFLALWGWRELDIRRMRESVETEKAEIRQLMAENHHLTQRNERMFAAVASPQTRTIALAGQHIAASGKMFVDPAAGRAIVVLSDLPPNGASKNYQLWITRANAAKPQSAGVFDVPPSGNATLTIDNVPAPEKIKSLGVTLEPKGGAEAPSGEYVLTGRQ